MSETSHSISTVSVPRGGEQTGRRRRRLIWAIAILAVIAGAASGAILVLGRSNDADEQLPTARVVRGPMVVSVTESGEVKAEEREVITNPVRWSVVIKEVAEEGKIVQEGELIIRMECKNLEDAILDQELSVRSADDAHQAATTKHAVTRKTAAAKVAKAKQAVQDAKDDLKKYEEGEWPLIRQPEADTKILLAEQELKLAVPKLKAMKEINADKTLEQPYSQSEIAAEELKVRRLQLNLTKVNAEKRILQDYTHKRTLRSKQTAVRDADLDLETTELQAETDVRLAETGEESAKMRLTKQQDRLKELREDAAKLIVHAKKAGLVVYETRRRRWDQPINVAVGEEIRAWQQLMIIPNMETLQVETSVYEAVREQVHAGLPALVRLDAWPGRIIAGQVVKVAPLPNKQNPWLSPNVKVYPTVVNFQEKAGLKGLKPGMSADVEVILAELEDVLSVPIAGIFADGETTYCFRMNDNGGCEPVEVTVGRTSETRAQILSGLKDGDTVLLVPPPGEHVGKKLKTPKPGKTPTVKPTSRPTSAPAGRERPIPAAGATQPSRPAHKGPVAREGGRRPGRSGRPPRKSP